MAIFAKRPLAAACAALLAALVLAEVFSFLAIQAILLLGALLFFLALLLCILRARAAGSLLLLLLSLGILAGALRVLPVHLRERSLRNAVGEEHAVTLRVRDILTESSLGSEILVDVTSLSGEVCEGRAILRLDSLSAFLEQDEIETVCVFCLLDEDEYTENRHLYYRAEGAIVQLRLAENAELTVREGSVNGISRLLDGLRIRAVGRLSTAVQGEAGDLAVAMLLGDRTGLSASAVKDFRYAGASHLLALSGLHLGILALLLEKLLLGIGLPRHWRAALLLLLLAAYLTLTGFSVSLLRASLMLLTAQLAFFCRARADSLTSLLLAATVLLLFNPFALYAASFQMTVLATFGILTVGTLSLHLSARFRKRKGLFRVLLWVPGSLLLTLAASLFTYPVQWFTFGEVSLITPLSNLLLIPLTALFLYLAAMTLLLFPAGLFGKLAALLGKLLLSLTHALGHPSVMLSLRQDFLPYLLIPTLILTALLLVVRLRHRIFVLLPHVVATVLFFVILGNRAMLLQDKVEVYYGTLEGAEAMVVRADGMVLAVELSTGSRALTLGSTLFRETESPVPDYYLLLSYEGISEGRLSRIADRLSPHTLLLPTPRDDAERERLFALTRAAAPLGMAVSLYEPEGVLPVFSTAKITVTAEENGISLLICGKEESICYQTAAVIAPTAATYHILSGIPEQEKRLLVGGVGTTVVVASEAVEAALIRRSDTSYLLFPQNQRFLLH